jgi:DNA repair and recombination RAD54-like protein
MSDTESEESDLELELTEPDCSEEEESDEAYNDSSSEDEGSDDDQEPEKEVVKVAPKPKVAVQVEVNEDEEFKQNEIVDNNEEEDEQEEEEEDFQPSAQQQAERREKNIKAMLDGSLDIHRKPLLPKLLTVQDATAVLRKPFKSPHPNAPARSDALRRALVARKQFVPWGASGKPFQAPVKFIPQSSDDPAAEAAAAPVELPPGIEPLVLWEPPPGTEGNPVRVDNMLTRFLRPHQREGVQFMFECVCGLRSYEGNGCILADDMGLGKTLQGITLLWTLLNNGHEALGGAPLARRIIICCPTSLVSNWDSECTKWLNGRVRTLPLCESSREDVIMTINQFLSPRNPAQLLIVSYETFRLHADRFQGPDSCDLLICDEAHRLKNDQTLTNKALDSLACRRRVLLSGTPMQNQLQEFYAMVNFANPGVLGTPSQFRRTYESPILAGREPDASDAEATLGAERSSQLSEIVNEFILRRTNSILSAHLPPKVVEVVCCRMTPLQYDLYCHFVQSRSVQNLFATQKSARALSAITSLRKLLNHPKLIYDMVHSSAAKSSRATATEGGVEGFEDCGKLFPPGLFDTGSRSGRGAGGGGGGFTGGGGAAAGHLPYGWEAMSGKFAVVARMLALLREQTKDRVVIVSNYTQTLDLFTNLCRERGYPVLRLDGSTSISKRQKLVKRFNDPMDNQYVFLLSSKAGGCGLNLIGGNRLILFDMSWNPADDKQAAARVWRDGQRRRVFVYRFMTTGTIEEKVYQRQLSKEGLQAVVDTKASAGAGGAVMSLEELRDLFSYDPDTLSTTYDHMVATKGLPKKKKPDKPLTKKALAAEKKAKKEAAKKKAEMEFEDSEDEDIDVVLDDTDEEVEDAEIDEIVIEDEEEEDDAPAAALPTAGHANALLSKTLAASGGIFKEQDGNPKEEDLAAWGHHSDPTTVPDDLMQLTGGEDVTFVFSCQVDGRDVPLDAPLVPLGEGKAKTTGGLHGAMAGGGGAGGGGMRRHMAALARPANGTATMPMLGAARKNGISPAVTANVVATAAAVPSPAAGAVAVGQKENQNQQKEKAAAVLVKKKEKSNVPAVVAKKSSPPSAPPVKSVTVPAKVAGTKRPSPTSVATTATAPVTKKKLSNAGATASAPAARRRSSNPQGASAPVATKRVAILCDSSDDDFK